MSATEERPRRKGRGYPPEEHRFKPGKSGNPKGRPPGAKNKLKGQADAVGATPGDLISIAEAHRTVKGTDGSSLTTIAAIHRARNISAIKGNRLAAKDADRRLSQAEERIRRERQERFNLALEGQYLLEFYCHAAVERGLDLKVYPHPDDIHFDWGTLDVSIRGPISASEARELEHVIGEMTWLRGRVSHFRRTIEKSPQDKTAHYWLLRCTDIYLQINEMLPERYKQKRLSRWSTGKSIPFPPGFPLEMRRQPVLPEERFGCRTSG